MNSNHSQRFSFQELTSWKLHASRDLQKAKKRRDSIIRQMRKGVPPELLGPPILRLYRQTRECGNNGDHEHLKERLDPQRNIVNWTTYFQRQLAPLVSDDWYSTHIDDRSQLPTKEDAGAIMLSIEHERGKNRANSMRYERMEEEKEEESITQHIDDLLNEIRKSHFCFLKE